MTIIIIIFAVVITATVQSQVQGQPEKAFSQVITVGPVWTSDVWSCISDADFMVYGALRALNGTLLAISIDRLGTQSLYSLDAGKMETFAVGSPAGHKMDITSTGTISGWITLQTTSGATAGCHQ